MSLLSQKWFPLFFSSPPLLELAVFSKCVLENSGAGIKYKYLILRESSKKKKYIFVLFLLPDQFFLLFLLSLTSLHLLIKRLVSSFVESQQIFLKSQQLLWLSLWNKIAHTRMCWVSSYIITSPTRLWASNSTSLESSATCCAESPLLFSNFILGRLWCRPIKNPSYYFVTTLTYVSG